MIKTTKQDYFFSITIILTLVLLTSVLLNTSFANAKITFSSHDAVYNLGDNLRIKATVPQEEQSQGFLKIMLICYKDSNKDNNYSENSTETETLVYFSPITLDKEKTVDISFPVSEPLGKCYLIGIVEDNKNNKLDNGNTTTFLLTDKININAGLNKDEFEEFEPSEKLKISGQAFLENGKKAEGIIEIFIDNKKEGDAKISRGKFSYEIKLQQDINPGKHEILLEIKDNNNNNGKTSISFSVKQIPTSLLIEINNNTFIPGGMLIITPKLIDQADEIMPGSINIKLYFNEQGVFFLNKKNKKILIDEQVQSGNSTLYRFTNTAPGNYTIEASTNKSLGDLIKNKKIYLEEFENLSFKLKSESNSSGLNNSFLTITNIGNMPYKKTIKIFFEIQNYTTSKWIDLDLGVGESKTFELEAPKGTYNLEITKASRNESRNSDSNETNNSNKNFIPTLANFSGVPLTGDVVATIDIQQKLKTNRFKIVSLLIALVVLLTILSLSLFKIKSKKKYQKYKAKPRPLTRTSRPLTRTQTAPAIQKRLDIKKNIKRIKDERAMISEPLDKEMKKTFLLNSSNLAANTIVPSLVYGTKQEISALFVSISLDKLNKIKNQNPEVYKKLLNEYLSKITKKIKSHQGVADLYGNDLIIIFNVIKQYRHDIAAIRTAQEIKEVTEEFNNSLKKINPEIELNFKAGINSGLATLSNIGQDKSIKYTSIGNTTALAKALIKKATDGQILLTDNVYRKVSNIIKAKKIMPLYLTNQKAEKTTSQNAIEIYSLLNSSNADFKERNRWYIDRALK